MKYKVAISSFLILALLALMTLPASAHEGVGGDELAAADSMWIVAVLMVLITGIGVMFSWHNGEFRNPERIKITMLEMGLTDETGDELDKYALTEA